MTTLQQLEADKKQETVSSTLGANEMRVCKATNSKGLAFTSSPSTDLSCCSSEHHQPLKRNIMEENIRMRQALNGMVLTLNRWIHRNKELTGQVKLLVNTINESEERTEEEHQVLRQKLESMAIKMKALESDLSAERQNRLQADRERGVAKQMILKLQQENWGLRKGRSVSFSTLLN